MRLRDAMQECLRNWRDDLPTDWRRVLSATELAFADMDPTLTLETWEPIFPVRKGKLLLGMPEGAHMLRGFEGVPFDNVHCVVLGQDPYPDPGFATGRAFEAGNVARWCELDKMFSKSVRCIIQQVVAARTGDPSHARSFDQWPRVRDGLDSGAIPFDTPRSLVDRWQASNVLLLGSALTITRFAVAIHPHQARGHIRLWRPLIAAALLALLQRGLPLVVIGLGAVAAELLAHIGLREGRHGNVSVLLRHHPWQAEQYLDKPNPFSECNVHLGEMGAPAVAW